jgi:Cu/Ag efflux protein CusF
MYSKEFDMKYRTLAVLALGAAIALPAFSQSLTDGEIRKVDKATKKITIKHGRIANLDMPGMTMVFQAADPAMVDKVKAGDKVKFAAEDKAGVLTVTKIEAAK